MAMDNPYGELGRAMLKLMKLGPTTALKVHSTEDVDNPVEKVW
jgi:hypothetical protein